MSLFGLQFIFEAISGYCGGLVSHPIMFGLERYQYAGHIDISKAELSRNSAHGFQGWVVSLGRTLGMFAGMPVIIVRVGMIVFLKYSRSQQAGLLTLGPL